MVIQPSSLLCLACVATFAAAPMAALAAAPIAAPTVPDAIKAPEAQHVVLRAHAKGSQVYVCGVNPEGKPQWTLKGPDAELQDSRGKVIGRHFAGPTWRHQDGSEVTGKAVVKVDSPDPRSVPWLLLTATGHTGSGLLANVTSIQRVHTEGGQPPESGCDSSKAGTEIKSPYSADYYFYVPTN